MKLTQRKLVQIKNEFETDAEGLMTSIQIVFQKHKYRTEALGNKVNFTWPVGFTTHSGENEMAGMKTLRLGHMTLKELPDSKIEITGKVGSSHLVFIALLMGIPFYLIGIFSQGNELRMRFILIGLMVSMAIIVIGRRIIKDRVAGLIDPVKKRSLVKPPMKSPSPVLKVQINNG